MNLAALPFALALLLQAEAASAQHPPPPRVDPAYDEAVLRELQHCDSEAGAAVCRCNEEAGSPGLGSVTLTLAVGDAGRVLRVEVIPDGPLAACLRTALLGRRVKAPPSVPWFVQVRRLVPGEVLRR